MACVRSSGHDGPVSTLGDTATPPPAARATRPGWRDPRLWIGVVIVAASVVAGARLLGAADESVAVWAVSDDLPVGHEISADDLTPRRVRFVAADGLGRYFPATEALPAGSRLLRGVGAGELLPRAAVGEATDTGMLSLPIAVEPALLPPAVGAGSVVDVYVAPRGGRCPGCAGAALSAVTVTATPTADQLSGVRQVVVRVAEADADRWFELLARVDDPRITVASRG
jgi:hypothetical protein